MLPSHPSKPPAVELLAAGPSVELVLPPPTSPEVLATLSRFLAQALPPVLSSLQASAPRNEVERALEELLRTLRLVGPLPAFKVRRPPMKQPVFFERTMADGCCCWFFCVCRARALLLCCALAYPRCRSRHAGCGAFPHPPSRPPTVSQVSQWQVVVILLLKALSLERCPALRPSFETRDGITRLNRLLGSLSFTSEEFYAALELLCSTE